MRSRFAAFAAGEIGYLVRTLDPEHDDRSVDLRALEASLREVCRTHRFMGLRVLSSEERGDGATVRFFARVFEKGRDRSFEETSEFRRHEGRWRYHRARASE